MGWEGREGRSGASEDRRAGVNRAAPEGKAGDRQETRQTPGQEPPHKLQAPDVEPPNTWVQDAPECWAANTRLGKVGLREARPQVAGVQCGAA